MFAEDLRIGDRVSIAGGNGPEHIRVLNEVCRMRPTPHVHVVTNKTTRCYGFTHWLGRKGAAPAPVDPRHPGEAA